MIRNLGADPRAQRCESVTLRRAFGAAYQMLLDRGAAHRIELAVSVRGKQRGGFIAVHR